MSHNEVQKASKFDTERHQELEGVKNELPSAGKEPGQESKSNFSTDVMDSVKGLWRTYEKVDDDEGTPLRHVITSVRLQVNDAAVSAKHSINHNIERYKPDLSFIEKSYGSIPELTYMHKGLLATGAGLLIAIPSALAGRRRMLGNGLFAAGTTFGSINFCQWWDRRMHTRSLALRPAKSSTGPDEKSM